MNSRAAKGIFLIIAAHAGIFACDLRDRDDGLAVSHTPLTNLGSPTHGRRLASGDINGDGRQDFVVGLPDAGSCGEGEVRVWYDGYIEDMPEEVWNGEGCGGGFGASVTLGDFNADGYDDVAVGVPGDEIALESSAGSVRVFYGAKSGLTDVENQLFHQETNGVGESAEANDAYGTALASGDFDCDGYADLAVGIPGESIGITANAGAISVLRGSRSGIRSGEAQYLHQNTEDVEDVSEAGDHFGAFLAAGNIDQDDDDGSDCDDLVVGVPHESLPNGMLLDNPAVGAVAVFYGGRSGLGPTTDELWHQGLTGIPGDNEANDQFGRGVYLDDRNDDGFLDLVAIGHSDDLFYVIPGTRAGLTAAGSFTLNPQEGKVKDACIWLCNLVWMALPPGPPCDCSFCELYIGTETETPCPQCA